MSLLCDGLVAVVTGAGRGVGRGHALELARQGARVVVNDIGGALDGDGADRGPAQAVVDEIRALGGEAVADTGDVADWTDAQAMIGRAVDTFGRLDILVNNAGNLRDRMLVNMSEAEWDAVIRVHLKGTFAPLHFAAVHWRAQHKAGEPVAASVVNTTSTSGLFANPGQGNYGAAKSGIATLSIIAAKELGRYGVRVNAVAPGGLTRMTENLGPRYATELAADSWDERDPENVAPMIAWLASPESKDVTGEVFYVTGSKIQYVQQWGRGPVADAGRRWDPAELGDVVPGLIAQGSA
ncbi:putative short-chain dehydrogenase/reductase [Pseudonocardia sulfidoxydans NBRC 16205]|uniref:Putative short-chain dehydrogenase/reductase n=1 Tax=Pseudonocardia sulfidoxydans NBRC 16205 TaxID=1223511 RepID=A0A511DNZ6_9PSEU|nr:SDR family oxidoreductase [Pseudonocardia sulfidoxydans]GEL26542.1 putative short-chain dehydrogenase/reductase [Pseudonocardia sulfidoxydans NBRC 16205]